MPNFPTVALPHARESALHELETRRSKLHCKPAALLVMLEMLNENLGGGDRIALREYTERAALGPSQALAPLQQHWIDECGGRRRG